MEDMEDYNMTKEEFLLDLEIAEDMYNKGYFSINILYQIKSRIADEYANTIKKEMEEE